MKNSPRLLRVAAMAWLASACGGATDRPVVASNAVLSPREVDVSFESEGATSGPAILCGTLTLPAGSGPHAGVVLLHGSGAHDRNEPLEGVLMLEMGADLLDGRLDAQLAFRQPLPLFSELASRLAGEGFVVLRFDKRNYLAANGSPCGPRPPFPPRNATPDDFVADGAAAVRFLAARAEIDRRRVYVLGHSEGAAFAPVVASRDPDTCGVMGLAGTVRPIDQVILEQLDRVIAYLQGLPPGEPRDRLLVDTLAQRDALAEQFARVRAGTAAADEAILGAPPQYWTRWIALGEEAARVLPGAAWPLFLVRGTLDFNVSSEDLDSFRPAGAAATLVSVEGLTHAMNEVTTSGYSDHASSRLLRALVDWLRSHPC